MNDPREAQLFRHGIVGDDARSALNTFDARGGMAAAHTALERVFGHDAVRVAHVLLKES